MHTSWRIRCVCAEPGKSRRQRHTDNCYCLCLASVYSQVCLLCSAHCWPGFLCCSHQSGIPREERGQRESFSQSTASVWKSRSVYCSSQPVESLTGGRSLWVQGKVIGHIDSQASLVSSKNKPNLFVNLQIFTVALPFCKQHNDMKCREEGSGGNISFEFACLTLPTRGRRPWSDSPNCCLGFSNLAGYKTKTLRQK